MAAVTWCTLLRFPSDPPHNLALLSLLLLPILALSSYYYVRRSVCWHGGRRLPPGSLGLPLGLGENLQFIFGNNTPIGSPRPFLSSRLRKYGTIFKTHLLGYPTVISMDADFNKFLLSNEGKIVKEAYPRFMKEIIGKFMDVHGKRHLQLRELFKSTVSWSAIQDIHFIPMQKCVINFLHSWSHKVVDAQAEFKKFLYIYMLKFLLNLEPEDPTFVSLVNDYEIVLKFQSTMPMDIPGTTYNKIIKARKRIITKVGEFVRARRKAMGPEPPDFINVITKEKHRYNDAFDEEEIIEILYGVIIASLDTTSALFIHVMKFLSKDPHVVDELRKEHTLIRMNKEKDELLTWDDFKQMQLTKMVIKETLRITNVAEFVSRETLQDILFEDMVIPKGWRIFVNFSMLHLNPKYYDNPFKFDPWRWKESKPTNFYMPFGGGIRTCAGQFFTEFEVSIFLHYLITRYKWHVVTKNGGHDDEVCGHFMSKMENGLPIEVTPL